MKNNLEFCFDTLINDLEDMVELDKLTYLPEDSANIEELITWYNQNKDIFVLLKDDKKLIGYSIFFPITKECYNKYKNGEILEGEIEGKDILNWQENCSHYVLFNNISINPKYQNGEAIKILTQGIKIKIDELKNKNIKLNNVVAECDSPDGIKYLTRTFNFKPVGTNNARGILYEGKMLI